MVLKSNREWIAFLGPDGAGKSSVIEGVEKHLNNEGIVIDYHHWKPKKPSDETAENRVVQDPHGEAPRPLIVAMIKSCLLLLTWRWRFFSIIKKRMNPNQLVVFDRFYDDLYCDPLRYRYIRVDLISKWFLKLMPKPSLVIVLDAPVSTLLERKQEVAEEVLAPIVEKYRKYASNCKRAALLDTDAPLQDVIQKAVSLVVESTVANADPTG